MEQKAKTNQFIRNIDAGILYENFLVSAVSAILIIRFYLNVTGYPQIGGSGFHIAHMLWGGLLMLIAQIILLGFLNRQTRHLAATIGGFGFGVFIDELGKFLTSDNNYFFQPTVAIIYVIFISLFILSRAIERYRKFSPHEYLINALEITKEVIAQDLDEQEQHHARLYLSKSDQNNPFTLALTQELGKTKAIPVEKPNIISQIKRRLSQFYFQIITKPWFARIVIIFFALQAINALVHVSYIIIIDWFELSTVFNLVVPILSVSEWTELIFSTFAALFVIAGTIRIHTSRLEAFYLFKRSLLISIFFVQFFSFYQDQFYALTGLLVNIVVLVALDYMINQEELGLAKSQLPRKATGLKLWLRWIFLTTRRLATTQKQPLQ